MEVSKELRKLLSKIGKKGVEERVKKYTTEDHRRWGRMGAQKRWADHKKQDDKS